MSKFIILCLGALAACEAGLIPNQLKYQNFPNLQTVHHGHGATSYQNVNLENYGSVPIPKDLQVDDGHEYHHESQYLNNQDFMNDHVEIPSSDLQHYVDNHATVDHVIVSTEAPYELDEHVGHLELESQHHFAPSSHYDHYEHEAAHEYH